MDHSRDLDCRMHGYGLTSALVMVPVSQLPALKSRQVLKLLLKIGYRQERQRGSHRKLVADGRKTIVFAFHDGATVPPAALRVMLVKRAGLTDREIADLL